MTSKTNITPLFDNVLIEPAKADDITAGGIVLPGTVKDKPQMGTIMAIGTGAQDVNGKLIPMIVKVGQKVLYTKWGGNEVKVGNKEWKIVKQSDILAIIQ